MKSLVLNNLVLNNLALKSLVLIKVIIAGSMLLLTACAHSPQQIVVSPEIIAESVNYGAGRSIAVTAQDNRTEKVLGSRGGVYDDTSLVTISNDLAKVLSDLTKEQLSKDGFAVTDLPTLAMEKVPSLQISVEDIRYSISDKITPKELSLTVVISAEAYNGRETYTRRFETTQKNTLLVAPSMNKNTEVVNKAFSETLNRLFSDPQLKAFLSSF